MGFCSLRVVKPPAVEPVSDAEAAVHLRLDNDTADVRSYVMAARSWAEQYLNRALITQQLRFTITPARPSVASFGAIINPIVFVAPLSWWPLTGIPIDLPMAPVQSIDQVSQRAVDGTVTVLDPASGFYGDATNEPARVTLRGVGQPQGSDLSITYTAGYGDLGTAVPAPILQAIKLLTGFFYEHRGDDDAAEPPAAVKMLLSPYRQVTFA